ncbi:MAG: hypothetical protein ACR2QR_02405 [Woeseiaceae bacterium]
MLLDTDIEVLLTFAEVAAAFAGFSAVAGIFGERSKKIAQQDAERLRAVILNSILVLVAAFAPLLISRYGVEEGRVWWLASLIALPCNWLVAILLTYLGAKTDLWRSDKIYKRVSFTLEIPVELALIINVLGFFTALAPALYMTFIFLVLLQSAVAFATLLHSLFSHRQY